MTPDRNLLFGVIAMQMNFVGRDALVAAMNAWILDKQKPLGRILLEQNHLTTSQMQAVDSLIVEHLKAHGDDPQRSLQALSTISSVGRLFAEVHDADFQSSLLGLETVSSGGASRNGTATSRNGSRFRILRPHARGGLGEVFVAEDTELHREVALKEIQENRADDPGNRSRFVLEAQITGGLEHPGIVPVYGLGVHPDGRPFYAMRFIRGESFKTAIEEFHKGKNSDGDPSERRLNFRQLLRRFIDVCNAIAYAHSRGVLHRDLKPSNVMLGPFGETLVVDWGLAKAGVELPHPGGDATVDPALRPAVSDDSPATRVGSALGTPPFMSPEQAAGKFAELGPSSDICSLGATLYMLLTGQKPFDGTDNDAILARVRAGQFPPPRQVKMDVPPALDAICRKAMALNPSDRYASALDLAADVDHWLADEPAVAYRDPWTVKVSRWARRHRTKVVAVGVFLVSAVVGLSVCTALVWKEKRKTDAANGIALEQKGIALEQKGIALEQKGIAEKNYDFARNLSMNSVELIFSAEAEFAAVPSKDKARREILKSASKRFREFLSNNPSDVDLRQKTALVYRYAANVHRLESETEAAESLYRDAIAIYEGLASQFPEERMYRFNLSELHRDRASNQGNKGQLKEAAESLQKAVDMAESLWKDQKPDQLSALKLWAIALNVRSTNELERGLYDAARKSAEQSLHLFNVLLFAAPALRQPYDPILRLADFNLMAIAERELGHPDVAAGFHREAVDPLIKMAGKEMAGVNPNDVNHFLAAFILEKSRTAQKIPKANLVNVEKNVTGTITKWTELGAKFPRIPIYRHSLAVAYQTRGQFLADQNRGIEAQKDLEKSRMLLLELVKELPQIPSPIGDLSRTDLALARLARREGKADQAADYDKQAADALAEAGKLSPDNAMDQRTRVQLQAERAK